MEARVYRQSAASAETGVLPARSTIDNSSSASVPTSTDGTSPLSPALFYPLVTEQERVTWTHWLPTSIVFERLPGLSPLEIITMLDRLKAPPEVLEEFHWTWKMDLFEAYEVRTPVRRDARDPLLLGRFGGQWYRLALWGESIRPLEEMTALVQQSLALRAQAARRRLWFNLGCTLPGLALLLGGGYLWQEGRPVGQGLLLASLLFFLAWLPMLGYTPDNCQHDFLDRYRC
jgi:hypothetical protein